MLLPKLIRNDILFGLINQKVKECVVLLPSLRWLSMKQTVQPAYHPIPVKTYRFPTMVPPYINLTSSTGLLCQIGHQQYQHSRFVPINVKNASFRKRSSDSYPYCFAALFGLLGSSEDKEETDEDRMLTSIKRGMIAVMVSKKN